MRPITTRLNLIAVCQAVQATKHWREPAKNVEVIQNAEPEQIKRAIQLVSDSTGNNFSHRRTRIDHFGRHRLALLLPIAIRRF